VLALDGISDPGNLGTMIRTADWFGIKDIICGTGTADCFAPKVVQAAMGSLFRLKFHYAELSSFINDHHINKQMPILVADGKGDKVSVIKNPGHGLLVIGSESHGVSDALMRLADIKVAIPRHRGSVAESLNAGVACAILLSHLTTK
jgi:TrmH family RNA methyltransferase